MKILLSTIITIFFIHGLSANSLSDHNKVSILELKATTGKVTSNIIKVSVNGLVCDFCAQSIEKVFMKKEEVKGINVNLEAQSVILFLKDKANLIDKEIYAILEDAGYSVENIRRKV